MPDIYITVIEDGVTGDLEDNDAHITVIDDTAPQYIEIGVPGPAGPAGAPGSAPQAYEHVQVGASDVWTVNHNLGFRPNVSVEDSLGREVEGNITYLNINSLQIDFSAAMSGTAYLS